jgi:broad specificity phosphatase PhoE
LKDFNYGQWTGLENDVVAQRWPEDHVRWTTAPHTVRAPDGDTLQEVFDRALNALEEIVQKHKGQTAALFAHRVVNKLLVLGILTLKLERFPFIRQDNCCLNEFERTEKGYNVITLNDTNHIRQAGTELLKADF